MLALATYCSNDRAHYDMISTAHISREGALSPSSRPRLMSGGASGGKDPLAAFESTLATLDCGTGWSSATGSAEPAANPLNMFQERLTALDNYSDYTEPEPAPNCTDSLAAFERTLDSLDANRALPPDVLGADLLGQWAASHGDRAIAEMPAADRVAPLAYRDAQESDTAGDPVPGKGPW